MKSDNSYLFGSHFSPNSYKLSRKSLLLMKCRNFVTIAIITTALILASIAVSLTPEYTFAYNKNQATSHTNACGNGEISTNVGCQDTDSQIEGDKNSVALVAQQTFPQVFVEEPPAPPSPEPEPEPQECEACFNSLTSEQKTVFEELAATSIEDLCIFLEDPPSKEEFTADIGGVATILQSFPNTIAVDTGTIINIIICLATTCPPVVT